MDTLDFERTRRLLRSLREKNHLSQARIAEVLNVSEKTYCNWENNTTIPLDALLTILRLFKLNEIQRISIIDNLVEKDTTPVKNNALSELFLDSGESMYDVADAASSILPGEAFDKLDIGISCLKILEDRITCDKMLAEYILDSSNSFLTRQTAVILDQVASEFGITIGAEHQYIYSLRIDKLNEHIFDDFLLEIDNKAYSEEVIKSLKEECSHFPETSKKELLLEKIKDIYEECDLLDRRLQSKLSHCNSAYDLDNGFHYCKGYEIDINGILWEKIFLRGSSLSFRKTSTPEMLEEILAHPDNYPLSIIRTPYQVTFRDINDFEFIKEYKENTPFGTQFYIPTGFVSRDKALKALAELGGQVYPIPHELSEENIVDSIIENDVYSKPVYDVMTQREWITFCQSSTELQEFCKNIKISHSTEAS